MMRKAMKTSCLLLVLILATSGCGKNESPGVSGVAVPQSRSAVFIATVESSGLVMNLPPETRVIPVHFDANFALTLKVKKVESVSEELAELFEDGQEVIFAIHSPTLMLRGRPDEFVGESCKFVFMRKLLENGMFRNDLELDRESADRILKDGTEEPEDE